MADDDLAAVEPDANLDGHLVRAEDLVRAQPGSQLLDRVLQLTLGEPSGRQLPV
jgi:hypothetical protein